MDVRAHGLDCDTLACVYHNETGESLLANHAPFIDSLASWLCRLQLPHWTLSLHEASTSLKIILGWSYNKKVQQTIAVFYQNPASRANWEHDAWWCCWRKACLMDLISNIHFMTGSATVLLTMRAFLWLISEAIDLSFSCRSILCSSSLYEAALYLHGMYSGAWTLAMLKVADGDFRTNPWQIAPRQLCGFLSACLPIEFLRFTYSLSADQVLYKMLDGSFFVPGDLQLNASWLQAFIEVCACHQLCLWRNV